MAYKNYTCEEAREKMDEYLEDENEGLKQSELNNIMLHVNSCIPCNRRFKHKTKLRKMNDLLFGSDEDDKV